MKKLATLLLAAGMVVASTAPANAVDVKVDARYRFSFMTGSADFAGTNIEKVQQRLRLGLTMAASENLSGYFQMQAGKDNWGTDTSNAGNANIYTRMVYIDWKVPATSIKVRMGRHQFGLPAEAFGNNSILASGYGCRDGIVVSAPVTDWLGLTGIWARLGSNGTDVDASDNNDMFAVAANVKFDGFSGAVYGAYASLDKFADKAGHTFSVDEAGQIEAKPSTTSTFPANSAGLPNAEGDLYGFGFTSTFTAFDPFTLKVSAAFTEFNAADKGVDNAAGWNVQAKASYALPFGTPVLGAWYFSGADKDGKGVMPGAGYFTATRSYHDEAKGLQGLYGGEGAVAGSWGVQAGIEGVSFLEGLTHDFLVTYMQGTNEEAPKYMTYNKNGYWNLDEEDSLVHIDLVNTYKIYKNLAAHFELGYVFADFDSKGINAGEYTEDDWRAELTFEYKF